MAKVIFIETQEPNDKSMCERLKRKAISDISLLPRAKDKEAFAKVSIGANDGRINFKVIDGCCPQFQETAQKAIDRWSKNLDPA